MPDSIGWPLDVNKIRGNNRTLQLKNTFGYVRRDANGKPRAHQGWDFTADLNLPCYAIADGKVAMIYTSKDYGLVLVQSLKLEGKTLYAAFAHLSDTKVAVGATLKRGDIICHTGESGNAKGMPRADRHLHFELRETARPGTGLVQRLSPLLAFGVVPLDNAINRV